jgi:hypothetical protein
MKKYLFAALLMLSLCSYAHSAEIGVEASTGFESTIILDPKIYGVRMIRGSATNLHTVYVKDSTNIHYARSTNNGATWPAISLISNAASISGPAFQVGNNFAYVAFGQLITGTTRIMFSSADVSVPGTPVFSAPVDITPQLVLQGYVNHDDVRSINLFRDPITGNLHLVWMAYDTGIGINTSEIYYALSSDNGVTWTNFQNLSSNGIADITPSIVFNSVSNQITVLWTGGGIPTIIQARTKPSVGAFGGLTTYPDAGMPGQSQIHPAGVYDAQQNLHLTWIVNNAVRYQQIGSAVAPFTVSTAANAWAPDIGFSGNLVTSPLASYVPYIIWYTNPGGTVYQSSKISPTAFKPETQINLSANSLFPRTHNASNNDLTDVLYWSGGTQVFYSAQTDIVNPYKPDALPVPLGLAAAWIDQGACSAGTQQVFVSIAALPAGATQVRYQLQGTTTILSPFTAATSYTFTNVPDNQIAQISLVAQDAAGNLSVTTNLTPVNIADRTTGCFPFTITRPPQQTLSNLTCPGGAVGNFISVEWTDNDATPAGGVIHLFYDTDQNINNGVIDRSSGLAVPLATALATLGTSAIASNIPVANLTNSVMGDTSFLANGSYFVVGLLASPIATVNAFSIAPAFTKNNAAANAIPQIVMTSGITTPLTTLTSTYQYADSVPGSFSPLGVTLFLDTDNIYGNGAVVATLNPAIAPIASGAPNTGVAAHVYDFSTIPSGTYYLGGMVTDPTGCSSFDYYGPFLLTNPVLNSFGQQIFNFPNPFSPLTDYYPSSPGPAGTTRVVINQDTAHPLDISVYDTHGRMVWRTAVPAATAFYNFVFYGRDMNGNALPNGVYVIKAMQTDTKTVLHGRMTVLDK